MSFLDVVLLFWALLIGGMLFGWALERLIRYLVAKLWPTWDG